MFEFVGLRPKEVVEESDLEQALPGQLNTYVNYFRKNEMAEGDRPPIGLLLCTRKDASLAEYALGGMDENLFVSSYKTALPDAEELRRFLNSEVRRLGIGGES